MLAGIVVAGAAVAGTWYATPLAHQYLAEQALNQP